MAKLRVEDLKKIKASINKTNRLQESAKRVKITVHMGTCGIAAGAQVVMDTFVEKIKESGVTDLILTTSGCAGFCNHEPMVTVEIKGFAPVKYVKLDAQKTAKIFDEHVLNGNPVVKNALSVGSETTY